MDKNREYAHWNGKNPEGKSYVGNPDLLAAGPRNSKTAAKYDVSNETVAGNDLQKQPKNKKNR